MIETLSDMQIRIHTMREAVLEEDSLMPEEDYIITSLDAKKKVLWYLDRLAAVMAGAHRHISNIDHDDFLSASDKEEIQKEIVERLRQDLGWLPIAIKDYVYCLHKHFAISEADQLSASQNGPAREGIAERKKKVSEILDQLELLDREVDDMLSLLDANGS